MADLAPKQIVLSEINGGKQYNVGDGISPNAINDPIQASAYVQSLATNTPNTENVAEVGTPRVAIEEAADGSPRFVFEYLKGEKGQDAISPQIRINEQSGEWEISTDGGIVWETTGVKADYGQEFNEMNERLDTVEGGISTVKTQQTALASQQAAQGYRISETEKRLKNIEYGIPSERFVVDKETAYKKVVPANSAPYAMISMIGGASVIGDDGVAKSAVVPAIYLESANLITYPYYAASQERAGVKFSALEDGRVYCIGTATSTSSYFVFQSSEKPIYLEEGKYFVSGLEDGVSFQLRDASNRNTVFSTSTTTHTVQAGYYSVRLFVTNGITIDKTIGINLNKVSSDLPYSKWHEPKVAFGVYNHQSLIGYGQGNPLDENEYNYIDYDDMKYYQVGELVDGVWEKFAEPIVTNLNYQYFDNYFAVEQGGTLVFENENQLPVPSEITFQLKESVT